MFVTPTSNFCAAPNTKVGRMHVTCILGGRSLGHTLFILRGTLRTCPKGIV